VLYAEPSSDPASGSPAARLEASAARVRAALGADVFGEDETTLAMAVGEALAARGLTVAVAESCTAGLLGAQITAVAGSSRWFLGGVLAYADAVKQRLLGVEAATLAAHGAVSEPTAGEMARGARAATGADIGLAITGIAGPGGGSAERPVGLVCFAIAGPGPDELLTFRHTFAGLDRDGVRALSAAYALMHLLRRLRG
jgi:nicotinamide-nucleotide amidase